MQCGARIFPRFERDIGPFFGHVSQIALGRVDGASAYNILPLTHMHDSLARHAARVAAVQAVSFGHMKLMHRPAMTCPIASSFQFCKGSPSHTTEAPIPNTGTSSDIGATATTEYRASSQPQTAYPKRVLPAD